MPQSVPLPLKGELKNVRQLEKQVQQVANRASKNLKIDFTGGRKNIESLSQPLGKITGRADEFTKSMEAANARVIAFGASVGILSAVTKSFKELVSTTIEVEASLAKINSILNTNVSGLNKIKGQIFDIARETEQTFDTVSEAALELSRQGLSAEEVTRRLKDSLILARLSGVGAAEAVGSLTAAVNGFSKSGLTTSEILNKVSAAANKFAVSERDLFEGFKRSASVAQQAGVSLDELGGIITAVQQKTARGGAVIGNSFKTIFTRIGRSENLELLESVGVAITDVQGKILPATTLIEGLAKQLKNLDDVQVRAISEKIGGGFQIAPLLAALQDYSSENSIAVAATEAFANATDEAFQKNIVLNKTLSASIQSTSLSVKELANTLGELGVTDVFGTLLSSVQNVVKNITDLLQGDGIGSVFARGFVKGVSGLILPALGLVLVIVGKLAKDLVKFGVDSLKTFLGLNNAAEKLKNVEERTFQVLLNNESVRKQILAIENSSISVEQKRLLQSELFTKSLLGQRAVLQELQQISARVAPGIIAGTNPGRKRVSRGAGGFLPVGAESSDISKGVGGAPKSARPVVIPNFAFGGGQKGTMVANSSEYIVPNFAGGGSAIFNQDMVKSMGLPSGAKKINAAGGFIPNFAFAQSYSLKRIQDTKATNPSDFYSKGQLKPSVKKFIDENENDPRVAAILARDPKRTQREQLGFFANSKRGDGGFVMFLPQAEGYNPDGADTRFTKPRIKGGKTLSFFEGATAGIFPNLKDDDSKAGKKYSSFIGLDEAMQGGLEKTVSTLVKNSVRAFSGDPTGPDLEASEIVRQLDTGGAGAFGALKGAIFENIMTNTLGALDDPGSQLDVDISSKRPAIERIFDLPKGKFSKGDFKSSVSQKLKYIKQVLDSPYKGAIGTANSFKQANIVGKSRVSLPSKSRRSASGYIPNFAMSPLEDAIQREKDAGVPINQIRVNQNGNLRNSQNPNGIAVTNTRDEPTGAIPQTAAGGFVPNFVGQQMAESARRAAQKGSGSPTADAAADSSAKLFGLSTAAFLLQGAFTSVGEESKGAAKTIAELATGASQAVTTLLLFQGLGVGLGSGKGFLPSFGKGGGKSFAGITKLFTNLGKALGPVGKILGGFATKVLPRLIPGVGQALIAFQILSPLVKALANKFKPLGDALDSLKTGFIEFANLIPGLKNFVDTKEEKKEKTQRGDQQDALTRILSGSGSFDFLKEKQLKQDAIDSGRLKPGEKFDEEKFKQSQANETINSIIDSRVNSLNLTGNAANIRRDTITALLATLSKGQQEELVDKPQLAGSFISRQRDVLGRGGKLGDLDETERQILNRQEIIDNSKNTEKQRKDAKIQLKSLLKLRQEILALIPKQVEEEKKIKAELVSVKGILKDIANLRSEATLNATKALINSSTELEFQQKLQNSLNKTSDLTKSRNERELSFLSQQKKARIDLLDIFEKTIVQNKDFQTPELPGGKEFKEEEFLKRQELIERARKNINKSGNINPVQFQEDLNSLQGFAGTKKPEELTKLAQETLAIKNREISAKNAEKNINKENLNLIKLIVQEEKNRELLTQRILDQETENLKRKRTSAEIQKDLDISNLKLKAPSIRSEAQDFALQKKIRDREEAFAKDNFKDERALAGETLIKDLIKTLKDQGVNVDRSTQKGLRETFTEKGPEQLEKEVNKLLSDNRDQINLQKKEALDAKIQAKKDLVTQIQLNRNIRYENNTAADIQLKAARLQLESADPGSSSRLDELASKDPAEIRVLIAETKKNLALGLEQDPEGTVLTRIQQKQLSELETVLNSPSSGGVNIDTAAIISEISELEAKRVKLESPSNDGNADVTIRNLFGGLDDYTSRINDLQKLERIAVNNFDIALRDASGNLTNFGNQLLKEIAGSEQRRQSAFFQAKTSTDPSSIISGLSTVRRESVLQSTGSITQANESQLLLEKKLSLIEATTTAQRIQAEEEYEINLQILKIRETINEQSSPEEQEAAIKRIKALLSEPDTLSQGLIKALAVDGEEASSNIKNTLIDGAVNFKNTLVDGIIDATQKGADLKDVLLDAATQFLNELAKAQLNNAFGSIFDAVGGIAKSISPIERASGGIINGGSGVKDDVPAMLMGGEYVVRKSAVQKYGPTFMEKINEGQIEKFNSGGLVGGNFADIFGSQFKPNERNRFESSRAYGNPLKSGNLAIQTGEGGFLAPGVFGGGAIKGRNDLISFAGQGFTSGLGDTRSFGATRGGGFSSINLEPESVRLTNFGRSRGAPLQNATRDAKQQAFDAFVQENSERTRLKLEEKQRKKERKDAIKNAIIGAVVSTAFSAIAKSASAGFSNAFSAERTQNGGAANLFKSLGSGLKGIFTGGPIKGLEGNFGGLANIFSEKGSLTTTNLSSFFDKNPTSDIAEQYIKNNPGSKLAKEVKASRLLSRAIGTVETTDNQAISRQARSTVNEIPLSRATGGYVPSRAGVDTVPTMLSGGEFVLNSAATQRIGQGNLENLNSGIQENQVENQEDLLDKIQELVDLTKEGGSTGGNIAITVNSTSSGNTTGEQENTSGASNKKDQELARKIKDQVLQIINEEKRLGGTLRRL